MKVLASILSHNSQATLPHVVDGVESQRRYPDSVMVVDNASDAATIDYLATLPSHYEVHYSEENLGVGGGHNVALRRALADHGVDYVWLLENDSIPPPECLELLLAAASRLSSAGVRFGCVTPKQTHPSEPFRSQWNGLQVAPTTTFNGILIPRSTLEHVGLIREDFFIDQDDIEYSKRLAEARLPIFMDYDVTIEHLGKGRHRRDPASVVRTYYRFRNETYLRRQSQLLVYALAETFARIIAAVARTLVSEDRKADRIRARLVAGFDGLVGRLGRKNYRFLAR